VKNFLALILTWWNNQTLGTRLYTWRKGELVGEDGRGNKYYRTADGKKRWVIFVGETEASEIPAEWHGWLHHTFDELPSEQPLPRKSWEKPHRENLTGSTLAYHPPGSQLSTGGAAPQAGYEAWQPE